MATPPPFPRKKIICVTMSTSIKFLCQITNKLIDGEAKGREKGHIEKIWITVQAFIEGKMEYSHEFKLASSTIYNYTFISKLAQKFLNHGSTQ